MVLEMSNAPSQRTGATANITPGQQMISSCSGALATAFLTTPFDVIKVRLQAQQQAVIGKPCYLLECTCLDGVTLCTVTPDGSHVRSTRFSGTLDAFLKIAKIEGIGSWWKGLSPTILMAVPATMIYYTGYDQLKVMFGFREGHWNILAPALAGSIARTTAVTVVCPIELIRTKLQSRQGYNNREVVAVVRSAIQQNGILRLWRGLSPMLLRDVPFSVLYWISYEQTKMQLSLLNMNSTFLVPFLAGAISGTVSAIITNPLDVVKTHMQVRSKKKINLAVENCMAGECSWMMDH